MSFLNRESIFQSRTGLRTETVEAYGGKVLIRELTAGQAESLGKRVSNGDAGQSVILWVIASVVDPETLQPLFTEADTEMLAALSAADTVKVANAAIQLNGLTAEAAKFAAKN